MDKIGKLRGVLSQMKVSKQPVFYDKIKQHGNSDMFSYATNKRFSQADLQTKQLKVWQNLLQYDTKFSVINLPMNGFQEMINLTEQGRLWKYPIDNEQGMEAEKAIPFEDHVFLDDCLEEFPENEYIQAFMSLVIAGLAKNHWMTIGRKREIINKYKEYFEEKRESYKDAGFDM